MKSAVMNNILKPEIQKRGFSLEGTSNLPSPMETDDNFDILYFPCCTETVKVTRNNQHFCIICGVKIDMTISDSKKVFLSHKGVDKEMVKDFKTTLELMGYAPWLDEDAMPAGTSLERGLLQGMQYSCAVIFFITSSFKDENYLRTEIDYAIREKRRKEDKFAIISLQFVDEEGQTGKIPELLESYIWKKPKTSLEALREVIRALPVTSGVVNWREGITGAASISKLTSISTELSDEAKWILLEASNGNGQVCLLNTLAGKEIQINGKRFMSDDNPRTKSLWIGGFEDLQRRRYIKDIGNEGTIFEVTREGYAAADELLAT
jgi:hypothetical protein